MYVPKHFEQNDRRLLVEVMQTHGFALLVSAGADGVPFATHLPVVVARDGEAVRIEGHMARANPHWQFLQADPRALVVFSGPHCYVSPSLYQDKDNVPTWNYVAVHAYGKARLVQARDDKHRAQRTLVRALEPTYESQFDALDERYLEARLAGIVAFEIDVERLEGKFKLSQNRPAADQVNVHKALSAGDENAQQIARWMQRLVL